jgi:hypothetical protein
VEAVDIWSNSPDDMPRALCETSDASNGPPVWSPFDSDKQLEHPP